MSPRSQQAGKLHMAVPRGSKLPRLGQLGEDGSELYLLHLFGFSGLDFIS